MPRTASGKRKRKRELDDLDDVADAIADIVIEEIEHTAQLETEPPRICEYCGGDVPAKPAPDNPHGMRECARCGAYYTGEAWEQRLAPRTATTHDRAQSEHDQIPGGEGADLHPEDFNEPDTDQAVEVELEHTDDPSIAAEIGRDHAQETADKLHVSPQEGMRRYYDELTALEREFEEAGAESRRPGYGRELTAAEQLEFGFGVAPPAEADTTAPAVEWRVTDGTPRHPTELEAEVGGHMLTLRREYQSAKAYHWLVYMDDRLMTALPAQSLSAVQTAALRMLATRFDLAAAAPRSKTLKDTPPVEPARDKEELPVKPGAGLQNILTVAKAAKPRERNYWGHWYRGAHAIVAEMADRYHLPLETVAGVVAVMSPGTMWRQNIGQAKRLIEWWLERKRLGPLADPSLAGRGLRPIIPGLREGARTRHQHPAPSPYQPKRPDVSKPEWAANPQELAESKTKPYEHPTFPPEIKPRHLEETDLRLEDLAAEDPEIAEALEAGAAGPLTFVTPSTPRKKERPTGIFGPDIGAYIPNVEKAIQILETGDATAFVHGPKVSIFYMSLVDPDALADHLVLDGHAINIWRGTKKRIKGETPTPTVGEREQIEADYRAAARELGMSPQGLQALTWYIWKKTQPMLPSATTKAAAAAAQRRAFYPAQLRELMGAHGPELVQKNRMVQIKDAWALVGPNGRVWKWYSPTPQQIAEIRAPARKPALETVLADYEDLLGRHHERQDKLPARAGLLDTLLRESGIDPDQAGNTYDRRPLQQWTAGGRRGRRPVHEGGELDAVNQRLGLEGQRRIADPWDGFVRLLRQEGVTSWDDLAKSGIVQTMREIPGFERLQLPGWVGEVQYGRELDQQAIEHALTELESRYDEPPVPEEEYAPDLEELPPEPPEGTNEEPPPPDIGDIPIEEEGGPAPRTGQVLVGPNWGGDNQPAAAPADADDAPTTPTTPTTPATTALVGTGDTQALWDAMSKIREIGDRYPTPAAFAQALSTTAAREGTGIYALQVVQVTPEGAEVPVLTNGEASLEDITQAAEAYNMQALDADVEGRIEARGPMGLTLRVTDLEGEPVESRYRDEVLQALRRTALHRRASFRLIAVELGKALEGKYVKTNRKVAPSFPGQPVLPPESYFKIDGFHMPQVDPSYGLDLGMPIKGTPYDNARIRLLPTDPSGYFDGRRMIVVAPRDLEGFDLSVPPQQAGDIDLRTPEDELIDQANRENLEYFKRSPPFISGPVVPQPWTATDDLSSSSPRAPLPPPPQPLPPSPRVRAPSVLTPPQPFRLVDASRADVLLAFEAADSAVVEWIGSARMAQRVARQYGIVLANRRLTRTGALAYYGRPIVGPEGSGRFVLYTRTAALC